MERGGERRLGLNTALTELCLGCMSLGEGGGRAIGEGLGLNTTLTRLYLPCISFGGGAGRAL